MPADLATMRTLFEYNDWSNARLVESSLPLDDDLLDRDMQMGPGTLRRCLTHILAGESVWLRRWRREPSVPWPDEKEKHAVAEIGRRLVANAAERDAFLASLSAADLAREQPYRDSKGSLFRATLSDMLLQGFLHSKHHQAQAVNMIRRLGGDGAWPELDYMMRVRRPEP